MINADTKYLEVLLDLSQKKEFVDDIRKCRSELGMPLNGFKNEKAAEKFRYKNVSPHSDSIWNLRKEYIIKKYSKDHDLLKKLLAWSDFYDEGKILKDILKKYKVSTRASYVLFQIVVYSKSYWPIVRKKLLNEKSGNYSGCDFHYDTIDGYPNLLLKEIRKIKSMHLHEDLCATIMIYPEAKKSDVIKMINDQWYPWVDMQQKKQAEINELELKNIRSKTTRALYERIYKLHKNGLNSRQIASELKDHPDITWPYIRKAINIMKKREK